MTTSYDLCYSDILYAQLNKYQMSIEYGYVLGVVQECIRYVTWRI
jgi:hypothetical protein